MTVAAGDILAGLTTAIEMPHELREVHVGTEGMLNGRAVGDVSTARDLRALTMRARGSVRNAVAVPVSRRPIF